MWTGRRGSPFVKRIVGLPGEVVSEHEGVIHIDGDRLTEPYIALSRRGHENRSWPRVTPGHYFVLGDNRCSL